MKTFVCEMCGGNAVEKVDDLYVCTSCGTKFSPDDAKKMFVEVTVKEDTSQKLATLLEAAKTAREADNWKSAEVYYRDVMAIAPDNWEGVFFSAYAQAVQCKIANISSACTSVTNVLDNTFKLIKEKLPAAEQNAAVKTVVAYSSTLGSLMYQSAKKHYDEIDPSIKSKYTEEARDRMSRAMLVLYECGKYIDVHFKGTDIAKNAAPIIKKAWETTHSTVFLHLKITAEYENSLIEILGKYDPQSAEVIKNKLKAAEEAAVHGMKVGGIALLIIAIAIAGMAYYYELPAFYWGTGIAGLLGIFLLLGAKSDKKK